MLDPKDEPQLPKARGWQSLTIEGAFAIQLPPGATHAPVDGDPASLALRLPTRPVTEVLVGNYFINSDEVNVGRDRLVRDAAEAFVSKSIRRQIGTNYPPCIEVSRDGDVSVCRGVLLIERRRLWRPSTWWCFWLLARDESPHLWLIHWNGPERYVVPLILPMFATFEPTFRAAPSTDPSATAGRGTSSGSRG